MLLAFSDTLQAMPHAPGVVLSLALMLFGGFAMTRLTKLVRLPNVTAYILIGILMGPDCLALIPGQIIQRTDFLADIALALIAFGAGEFFRAEKLKKTGLRVLVIVLVETTACGGLVFALCRAALGLPVAYAIVLAALAAATAPSSMVMVIRQTHAKGPFVDMLLQAVALDDVVSLVSYSVAICVALAVTGGGGAITFGLVAAPIAANLGVIALGTIFGVFLKLLMPGSRSKDNRLIISLAVLFAFCGVCALLNVSPLLGCMSMGMVYMNLTDDKRLFQQLNYFSPPILLLFFVRSGLNFDLDALVDNSESIGTTPLVVVGILYFLVRIVGKYVGAFLGCLMTKKDKKVRNFLGLALIPQAGVAIGLAATGARTLGGEVGNALETIILASSVLYELIGPACAKLSLYLSGSYSNKLEDLAPIPATEPGQPPKSEVELLIARIQAIQQELPKHNNPYYEDEQAFTEAAAEHSAQMEAFFGTPGKANTAMPGRKRK